MIQLNDICLSYGTRPLFKNLTWNIKDGKRIGLFGPNGVGKTTLLNLISGRMTPDSGSISVPASNVIGYLPQEVQESDSGLTVLEEAMSAFSAVNELEKESAEITDALEKTEDKSSSEHESLLRRLDEIHAGLKSLGSHTIRFESEKLLMGLGFDVDDIQKKLSTFSGGWRMRVALAKLLLQKPNLLLLDEPTNHLDIESIDWLEQYLQKFQGSVILVSHDQYFLDRMVNVIAELNGGRVVEYAGNYSDYVKERRSRLEIKKAEYENQQRMIKDTERFIERFRAKNTKASQVQSRVKMLEKLERLEPPEDHDAAINFKFPEPERSGRVVYDLSEFSKTYEVSGTEPVRVFVNAGPLTVYRGDKIALIGKNGAGKSTLARIIVGTESCEGAGRTGHNVGLTYFAQHQADSLNPSNTILEELLSAPGALGETATRTLLGAFLFTDRDVFKPVKVLSGGEKSRVALAKTLLSPKNFMILDEPTNHLDIKSRNVLVEAMRQYTGTFIVVSHDRHFLDEVANKVWYVEEKGVTVYPGTYSEFHYHRSKKEEEAGEKTAAGDNGVSANNSEPAVSDKQKEAEIRNRLYKELTEKGIENMDNWRELSRKQLRSALSDLEKRIHDTEEKKESLEQFLADPSNFENQELSEQNTRQYNTVIKNLDLLYERWEEISSYVQYADGN